MEQLDAVKNEGSLGGNQGGSAVKAILRGSVPAGAGQGCEAMAAQVEGSAGAAAPVVS